MKSEEPVSVEGAAAVSHRLSIQSSPLSAPEIRDVIQRVGFARGEAESEAVFEQLLGCFGATLQVTDVTVRPESRALVTSAKALDFHTDHHRADIVAWYCVEQSDEGGESMLVDARAAYERLDAEERAALERIRLYEHKAFEGDPDSHPLVQRVDGRVRFYFSYLLVREPLGALESRALGRFRAALREVPFHRFRLAPGQWLVVANRRTLHGRSAILGTRKRLLRRRWVSCSIGWEVD